MTTETTSAATVSVAHSPERWVGRSRLWSWQGSNGVSSAASASAAQAASPIASRARGGTDQAMRATAARARSSSASR